MTVIDPRTKAPLPVYHILIDNWKDDADLFQCGHHCSKGNMFCWVIRKLNTRAYAVALETSEMAETYIRRVVTKYGVQAVLWSTWLYGFEAIINSQLRQLALV